RLTSCLKNGLLACALVTGWTLIDTVGATLYAVGTAGELARWGTSLFAVFAGFGAFSRSAMVLLVPSRRGRPPVPLSILSWGLALVVVSAWLVSINVASHAIAWNFESITDVPETFKVPAPPKILAADRIELARSPDGFVLTAATNPVACAAPAVTRPAARLSVAILVVLLACTCLFGQTTTCANLSSLHACYASRLTRTFLGASNPERLKGNDTAVKDTVGGDDCSGDEYWRWPTLNVSPNAAPSNAPKPWTRGGPLHIINTTVNETMDTKMKVQNQDRKGTGLAFGPCGLSLGIRHHLVAQS